MAHKNRTNAEIATDMTDIIVGHLESLPPAERKKKIKAFKAILTHDAKTGRTRPKVASSSRTRRYSRRIPA